MGQESRNIEGPSNTGLRGEVKAMRLRQVKAMNEGWETENEKTIVNKIDLNKRKGESKCVKRRQRNAVYTEARNKIAQAKRRCIHIGQNHPTLTIRERAHVIQSPPPGRRRTANGEHIRSSYIPPTAISIPNIHEQTRRTIRDLPPSTSPLPRDRDR